MKAELFNPYQHESRQTWGIISMNYAIAHPTLGLVNEAGELADKIKKVFRDKGGQISAEDRHVLKHARGAVLASVQAIAFVYLEKPSNKSLQAMLANVAKIHDHGHL